MKKGLTYDILFQQETTQLKKITRLSLLSLLENKQSPITCKKQSQVSCSINYVCTLSQLIHNFLAFRKYYNHYNTILPYYYAGQTSALPTDEFPLFGNHNKKLKKRGQRGLQFWWLLPHGTTQQPTESRPYRWGIYERGDAQGDDNRGGRRRVFLTIGFWGKKRNKTIFVAAWGGRQSTNECNNQPN